MPSHYMYPVSDIGTNCQFSLSENFYGLMGGGITALFDRFPKIFEQIQALSYVSFESILPIYHSVHLENHPYHKELAASFGDSWQDIRLVKNKFHTMFRSLIEVENLAEKINLNFDGYLPERAYFQDIYKGEIILDYRKSGLTLELYQKYFPELEEWYIEVELLSEKELQNPDEQWSFGHDICVVIDYCQQEMAKGAKKIRLNGR